MVVIKKYPNRRLYNTATSSYVNLEEIQAIIRDGTDVQIVESKTGYDVTTEMLLTRALDAEMLELLVPGEFVQRLLRVDRLTQQEMILDHVLSTTSGVESDVESETLDEGDTTITRVEVVAPESSEESSDASDWESESEVTIVRVEAPPSEPAVELLDHVLSDEVEVEAEHASDEDIHISLVSELNSELNMAPLVDETFEPFESSAFAVEVLEEALNLDEMESIEEREHTAEVVQMETDISVADEQNTPSDEVEELPVGSQSVSQEHPLNMSVPEASTDGLSKSDELKAKLEAMRARFKR